MPLPASSRWSRSDRLALLACIAVGVALAVAPHLAVLARYGSLEYLTDSDDVFYLAVARAPYYGEAALRDPYSGWWEHVPTAHAWALFAPLAKLAAALGVPLVLLSLLWRIAGGAMLAGALFVLFRRLFAGMRQPIAWAAGAAVVCLADAGFVGGRTVIDTVGLLPHLWNGTTPRTMANALAQYRVVTPILNLPVFLLLVAATLPGRRRTLGAAALGAVALGLCVLLYFYFWTAAVVGLGLYLLWVLLRGRHGGPRDGPPDELSEARFITMVLVGGLLIGMPQIVSNMRTFADPQYAAILARTVKGAHLAPDDPFRRLYLANFWLWAKLAVGAVGILVARSAGLRVLWCFTVAGYALANSALVTGLEFENSHWAYVHAPLGEILVLGTAGLLADRWPYARHRRVAWLLPAAVLLVALIWRPYEALHAPETVANSRLLREMRPLRSALATLGRDCALGGPAATNVALLYTRSAQLYQQPYGWYAPAPIDVVHERHALNGWLQGLDLPTYLRTTSEYDMLDRPTYAPAVLMRARGALFRQLEAGPTEAWLARYRPCYLLLPAAAPAPGRAGPWSAMARSATWTLWTRRPHA